MLPRFLATTSLKRPQPVSAHVHGKGRIRERRDARSVLSWPGNVVRPPLTLLSWGRCPGLSFYKFYTRSKSASVVPQTRVNTPKRAASSPYFLGSKHALCAAYWIGRNLHFSPLVSRPSGGNLVGRGCPLYFQVQGALLF